MSSIGELRGVVSRVADDAPVVTAAGAASQIELCGHAIGDRLHTTNQPEVEQAIAQLVEAAAKVREVADALDGVADLCRTYVARI